MLAGVQREPSPRRARAPMGLIVTGFMMFAASSSAAPLSIADSSSFLSLSRNLGGLHSFPAFQFSSFTPKIGSPFSKSTCSSSLPLAPPPPPRHALQTLVAQYRGRGRGGGGGRRGRGRGPPRIARMEGPPRNDAIVQPVLRVVVANPDGKDDMLGVMSREEALAAAEDRGQDLVMMSPDANPPVCKIINYDKLRYETEKKEKLKKKNTKNAELKEVKLSYKIDVHDYEVRRRATMKFLLKGDKVKASIRFKGREMAHQELAHKTMTQLMNDMAEIAGTEKRPTMEGRQMQMILAPTPEVLKQAEALRREKSSAKEKAKKGGKVLEDSEDSEDDEPLSDLTEDDEDEESDDEPAGVAPDYDLDSLSEGKTAELIVAVGERIRDLKAAEAGKEKIAPHVEELLALKARYQEVTGEAWAPAAASS